MKKNYAALVVGAGIGGIRAALDLAVTGHRVALIDQRPHHGGILAQLDHQFPNDHCGMCKMLPLMARDSASQYCLRKGLFHDNIDLYLSTELTALDGEPGRFTAELVQRSTLVDPHKCVSCGQCSEVCPVRVPNEFNAGLTQRPAVYLPVPHNIPNRYVVDLDNCLRCWQCFEACPTGAIDFKFEERKDFHILIADPDPNTGEFLADWLKAQNFPLHGVTTGAEAVDLLAEDDRFRLMLLDVDMQDMDAERVLLRAKELRPDLTVVLMASEESRERASELLKLGAREVLTKPLEPRTLVPWMDKLYMRILSDKRIVLDVGAVVLAGGFECFDPRKFSDTLGYGVIPGVVTAVEFERILSKTGPSEGKLLRPGDDKPAKRIAWIQCVGSRDLKTGADYCSSICCMFSLKEAVLARKAIGDGAETTIFYMDLRTFGKNFESYKAKALQDGVRLVRSRPHTIIPSPETGNPVIGYIDDAGERIEEEFDMVVLATGAVPPKNMARLAEVAGIDVNAYGFCESPEFTPERTSRLGVFAAGAFGRPKDIAESVIQSGAAAQGASRLIKIYDALTGLEPQPEAEYPDVSREPARTLVALCSSCPTLEQNVDVEDVERKVRSLPAVHTVACVDGACTEKGWQQIQDMAADTRANRILIGACLPYAYVPRLRELGRAIGLNPALMDVVDIYTPVMGGNGERTPSRNKQVYSALAQAHARLLGADPVPPPVTVNVARRALIVGGGLSGMTSAMAIADQGYEVVLVEQEDELGGQAMKLHYTLDGGEPRRHMEDLIEQVRKHPKIKVLTDARVVFSRGTAGRFQSAVTHDEGTLVVDHGVTILATGGHESRVYEYGFRVHKSVLSQLELEEQLATGTLDVKGLNSVAMIQCWRSRDEDRNYCSRVCCGEALKNILALKRKNPDLDIYVFYRDIMSYGFREHYYTEARKAGAIFIPYTLEHKPEVSFEDDAPVITAKDPILGETIQIKPDRLVLSSGVEPNEVDDLLEIFGVAIDENGFYQEADSKWRPVDFLKQGIFMCGLGRAPASMSEAIASAQAAAQRAIRILSAEKIARETVVATVRHSLCSLCQRCITACPYGARSVNLDLERIEVDEILCQGCGSCAAVCPNSATVLTGFHDGPMLSMIDAALEEPA